jgi:peptide/nickel transport system substrate-binding protein
MLAACPAAGPAASPGGAAEPAAPAASEQEAAPAAEGPKAGGTLRIALSTPVTHLDVSSFNQGHLNEIAAYFYETLFDRKQDGSIEGLLVAESQVSDDGLVHTWTLQPNVTFHDGTPLTAETVKWNFDYRIEEEKPTWDLIPIESVEAVDPATVRVTLTRPAPGMYGVLANKPFSIYDQATYERLGAEGVKNEANGTGPFMVSEFVPNERLVLVKNPNYWQEGLPYLDEVVILSVPDINTRATMLEAGDVEMAFDLSIQDIDRLKGNPDIEILEQFGSRQWYITLNNKKAPTDDVLVRKAINHAVDKQGIIDAIYLGEYATIARAVYLMPTIDGYSDAGVYEYDPAQAVALLEEAGWVDTDGDGVREKDGQPLALDLYTRQGGAAGDIETAELVQAMLAEVGIQTNIIVEDGASFVASVTKEPEEATYHMANLSVGIYTGDAEYVMLTFYACDSAAPRYYNRAYFCDPAVDALIEESETAPTMEARNEIYAQINTMVFEQAPILQLFDVLQTVAIHSNVEGIYFEPAGNNWPGKYAWLDQ